MINKISLLLISVIIACSSCADQSDFEPVVITALNTSLVNPQDGQRSYFLRYTGTCGNPVTASYTGDTLILSVSEQSDGLYFSESFTPGSPLFKQSASPVTYKVRQQGDYLLLPDRLSSALFYFYGNDTLFTNVENKEPLYQSGCKLKIQDELFTGEEIGLVPTFRFGMVRREELTAVSCVPQIYELDAYLFYNTYLHISHSVSQNGLVSGWVLSGI